LRRILPALFLAAFSTVSAVPLEEVYSPFDSGRDEVGVRALGLGGAFVGLADDLTASEWNPAGLAQLAGFRFRAEGSVVSSACEGDIHRFKRPWDPGYTVLIPPQIRGASLQPDFAGGGVSYGTAPWAFFSAITWARTKDGRRDETFLDPVSGVTTGIRQSGGIYHLTASHAVGWRDRWHAGIAIHGIPLGALEGAFTEAGNPDVPYAKIFSGEPAMDAGLLARPFGGVLEGFRIGTVFHGPQRMTFNYSDAWVADFDADYRHPSRWAAGASHRWKAWTASFQLEKDYGHELESVRKSTYSGSFPAMPFPIRYFDTVNRRVGIEWASRSRPGFPGSLALRAGFATRNRGYELRPESFLEEDRALLASFGRPRGSMLTWGLSAGFSRWVVDLSGRQETSLYERRTRVFRLGFGAGVRL